MQASDEEFSKIKSKVKISDKVFILRPLIDIPKKDLAYISKNTFNYNVKDPSNLDDKFLRIMDKSILLSKKIYDEGNKIDGAFFLAASYGFKGRLLSERKKWRKAAFSGRNALKFLKEVKGEENFIPEISFGNGLFNYFFRVMKFM